MSGWSAKLVLYENEMENMMSDIVTAVKVGTPAMVLGGLGNVVWRSDCVTCVTQGRGAFAPNHEASRRCKSGQRDHCTCGICF